jgi:hypothetical protein
MSRPTLFAGQDARATRPSIFVDHVGSSGAGSSGARLQAKRLELEGLTLLKEQSARLAKDIEVLGDNVDELVQGGEGG